MRPFETQHGETLVEQPSILRAVIKRICCVCPELLITTLGSLYDAVSLLCEDFLPQIYVDRLVF